MVVCGPTSTYFSFEVSEDMVDELRIEAGFEMIRP